MKQVEGCLSLLSVIDMQVTLEPGCLKGYEVCLN